MALGIWIYVIIKGDILFAKIVFYLFTHYYDVVLGANNVAMQASCCKQNEYNWSSSNIKMNIF